MSTPTTPTRRRGRPPIEPLPAATLDRLLAAPTPPPAAPPVTVYHHVAVEPLLYDAVQLAAAVGIAVHTARKAIRRGTYGPCIHVGPLVRVRRSDVEAWVAKGGKA